MKKHVSLYIVMIILILSVISACNKKPSEITIGSILPLSGDAAMYGKSLKTGMDLAIETINKTAPVGTKLNIIFEDDKNLPLQSVNAFNKLVDINKVPMVIGGMFSATALPITPIAESKKVVLLSPTASAIELTEAGDHFFRIYPSDSYDGKVLADFAIKNLVSKSAAIVALQASSTMTISDLFTKDYELSGNKILLRENVKENSTDFRTIIQNIKKNNPDLIFLALTIKEAGFFIKQAKESGLSSRLLGISTFNDPKILEIAGKSAEGVMFSSPAFNTESQDSSMVNFVKLYNVKYNQKPDILAGYGWDVVMMAYKAIQNSGKGSDLKIEKVIKNLYNIKDYNGVTGKMSFDVNGDVEKAIQIMKIKDNKFVPY